ncbi:hypothetical protein [uncultured Sphingomonas sp.]|uniref:hypothetical protein n=1 Tax=uncultured Sphingomonas sp. TaxID=158754 RepID=UPI002586B267|nr:hypothetical protein [uncultured Sphingomonas sp.]
MRPLDLAALKREAHAGAGTDIVVVTRRFLAQAALEIEMGRTGQPALDHDQYVRTSAT